MKVFSSSTTVQCSTSTCLGFLITDGVLAILQISLGVVYRVLRICNKKICKAHFTSDFYVSSTRECAACITEEKKTVMVTVRNTRNRVSCKAVKEAEAETKEAEYKRERYETQAHAYIHIQYCTDTCITSVT